MKWVWLFWISIAGNYLFGQTPSYIHYGIEEGLPSNLVYCVLEDREGYVWLGTDKGLARFDGANFKIYDVENGLPDPEVLSLYEDTQGRLWVACFRRQLVYRYAGQFMNEKTDTLLAYMSASTVAGSYQFHESPDSTLWISIGKVYQIKQGVISSSLPFVQQVHSSPFGRLGLGGQQILLLGPKGEALRVLHQFRTQNWGAFTGSGHRIFYSFLEKSFLMDFNGQSVQTIATLPESYQTVTTDRRGRFWGCSPGKGAVCFDNSQADFSNPVWYLQGKKVSNVYEDRQGNFWLLTQGEGVFMLPANHAVSWSKSDGLPSSNLLSLAPAPEGGIWLGDDIGNVHLLDRNQRLQTTALGASDGSNFVRQILPENDHQFWAVTDEGFYQCKKDGIYTTQLFNFEGKKSSLGAAKAIVKKDRQYWLGSNWQFATLSNILDTPQIILGNTRVTTLALDTEGVIWSGGVDGLFSSRDHFQFNWGKQFPLLRNRIAALTSGGPQKLWIVSPENGILEARTLQGAITAVQPLRSMYPRLVKAIKNIHVDQNGALWMASNKGVFCIDTSRRLFHFTNKHGLASSEVNDVLICGDTLWAATAGGLSRLLLNGNTASTPFRTVLTGVRYILGDSTVSLDFSGQNPAKIVLRLPHHIRLPELFFAGLQRSAAEDLFFQHIRTQTALPFPYTTFHNLWGPATDTLQLATPSLLLGTDLSAGRYLFHSTAYTLNGAAGEPVYYELWVLPHWSQTIWPWIAALGVAIFILWRIYRFRTRFLQMESAVLQLKLQALKAQINPHFVGNSINAIQKFFYPPNPEAASEYIHLFTVLLRKTLLLSEKDFITFAEEVQYDREYLEMIQLRYAGQFEYEITGTENIPPDTPFPAMFLQPILENATIHGLARKSPSVVKIHFEAQDDQLRCAVTDNGVGIRATEAYRKNNPSKHPSKGIELLLQKAQTLNYLYGLNIRLEWLDRSESNEQPNSGTQVKLSFQRLSKHKPDKIYE